MARRNYYRGKYKLSKAEFLSAKYYALRYHEWKDEYERLLVSAEAASPPMDRDGSGGGNTEESQVENTAIKMAELSKKFTAVEEAAMAAGKELYPWILEAVTGEDITYDYLVLHKDIPCGRDMFYARRREFYYYLSKKI